MTGFSGRYLARVRPGFFFAKFLAAKLSLAIPELAEFSRIGGKNCPAVKIRADFLENRAVLQAGFAHVGMGECSGKGGGISRKILEKKEEFALKRRMARVDPRFAVAFGTLSA